MPDVTIVGCKGSMGRRYSAILKFLGVSFDGIDYQEAYPRNGAKRALICTPSRSHTVVVENMMEAGYDNFLIEKPMFDREEDYKWALANSNQCKMQMVCNYKFINGTGGHTFYNYYDSGKEELWCNLFQLIGLANSTFSYHDESPLWRCMLNGRSLFLDEVHSSYITMIEAWMDNAPLVDISTAFNWFQKAKKWQQDYENWNRTSKQDQLKTVS